MLLFWQAAGTPAVSGVVASLSVSRSDATGELVFSAVLASALGSASAVAGEQWFEASLASVQAASVSSAEGDTPPTFSGSATSMQPRGWSALASELVFSGGVWSEAYGVGSAAGIGTVQAPVVVATARPRGSVGIARVVSRPVTNDDDDLALALALGGPHMLALVGQRVSKT